MVGVWWWFKMDKLFLLVVLWVNCWFWWMMGGCLARRLVLLVD